MKFLKSILIILFIFIAIPLLAAVFIKKEYAVEREITINKPKQEVFSYIKILKNQEQYNIWTMKDPNARKESKGVDGTVGFFTAWDSDNSEVGKGEQQIKNIQEGEAIEIDLHFIRPFEGRATTRMSTEIAAANQTSVK